MSEARAVILERIRRAVAPSGEPATEGWASIERSYRRSSRLSQHELVELFASRILHYDGTVLRCAVDQLPMTIDQALSARGKRRVYIPPGLDRGWCPGGVECVPDEDVGSDDLDRSEGVITGCTVAIALTGTIVLTHGAGEGRRALTLVPDYYLSVVFADQIVETVPEGLHRAAAGRPSLITTISGPSATADIEMTRVKGVHGPRTLDVIIVTTGR